jgi:hypothetical protein
VFGFGLAVSVAPLTTVAMSAVKQDRAGTASGINNAVARVAGLLSIAVLGVAMVSAFSSQLKRSLLDLVLPTQIMHDLQANEINLAGLTVPAGTDSNLAAAIRTSIERAFVFGFRLAMLGCAGLAFTSAAFARRRIAAPNPKEIQERYNKSRHILIKLLPNLTELRVYDNSEEADPCSGMPPEPKLILRLRQGRIVEVCDLAIAPEWTKPILVETLKLQI